MHPIIECAADVQAALKDVASVGPAFMATGEKQSALVALTEAALEQHPVVAAAPGGRNCWVYGMPHSAQIGAPLRPA